MKRISLCLCLCLLVSLFTVPIVAEGPEVLEPTSGSYLFNDNILELNNYVFEEEDEGYVIYSEEDLTINLVGDSVISGDNLGIEVDGKLTITGNGSLTVNYINAYDVYSEDIEPVIISEGALEINSGTTTITELLSVDSNLTINDGELILSNGTDSYIGPAPSFPHYSYYFESGSEKYCRYSTLNSVFYDIDDDENYIQSEIHLTKYRLADLDNLHTANNVLYYQGNPKDVVDGFVIFLENKDAKVRYDETTSTYYVNLWNKFNDDYADNLLEFVFPKSELGKVIEYKVLDSKNFYIYDDNLDPSISLVDDEVYMEPYDYVGTCLYSTTPTGNKDYASTFFRLVAYTTDNYVSLKAMGTDGSYKYINVYVKDENDPREEEIEEEEPSYNSDYEIVNTGVKS